MRIITFAILLGLVVSNCSSTSDYTEKDCMNSDFYYYFGEKVYLENLNFNYLVIGFSQQTDSLAITDFINNLNRFENITSHDIFAPPDNYKYIFAKFKTEKTCLKIQSEIEDLNAEDIVVFANKTYNTDFYGTSGNFDLMYTTDQFIVKLKENVNKSQLDEFISKIDEVSIIKEDEFVPNQFLMSNTNKNRTTISTSNLFYESGLFEFAEPNFGYVNF